MTRFPLLRMPIPETSTATCDNLQLELLSSTGIGMKSGNPSKFANLILDTDPVQSFSDPS